MKPIGILLVVVIGLMSVAYVAFQEGKEAGKWEVEIAEAHAKDRKDKIAAGWTPMMIEGAGRETLIPPPPPRPKSKTLVTYDDTFPTKTEELLRLHQDDINNLIRQMQIVQDAISDLESSCCCIKQRETKSP